MKAFDASLAAMLRGNGRWPADADPETLLRRAELHGVGALLHATAPPDVPDAVRSELREHALRESALELARRGELRGLLNRCAGAGIRPILLKGTALAHSHYREPWLRERADTDLLVRTDQRAALFAVLAAEGFRRADAAGGDVASSESGFGRNGSPLVLDVHWRIKSSPLLAGVLCFDELEAHAVPLPALGPHARGPGPVDAVLLAAIHRASHYQSPYYAAGVAHRGDRLIWLYDLHLLLPALTPGQAGELARLAVRQRVAGLCLDALRTARDAFGTALPAGLVEALERGAARDEPSMALLRGGRRRVLLAELGALPRLGERVRWLGEHAFPPADYMLRKYATGRRWLLPALYVRRALGWLARE